MFNNKEVDGTEIEFQLGERALNEIDSLHANFLEWLEAETHDLAQIVGRMMRGQFGDATDRVLQLKKDYIDYRKYECDLEEREKIAEGLLRESSHDD